MLRELARRDDSGLLVRLLWDLEREQAVIRYRDWRSGEVFATDVPNPRALDDFWHLLPGPLRYPERLRGLARQGARRPPPHRARTRRLEVPAALLPRHEHPHHPLPLGGRSRRGDRLHAGDAAGRRRPRPRRAHGARRSGRADASDRGRSALRLRPRRARRARRRARRRLSLRRRLARALDPRPARGAGRPRVRGRDRRGGRAGHVRPRERGLGPAPAPLRGGRGAGPVRGNDRLLAGVAPTIPLHGTLAGGGRSLGAHAQAPHLPADRGHRRLLGVVGEGYEPLQNRSAFAFCDTITDSGRAHWIGAGATRGGARVHALMKLDREIQIGGAKGEEVLPLLCFRNGHDGGLAVTVSVAPFRLACLNGMLLPLAGEQRSWKARHTANVEAKLADARRTLGIAWRYYDELEEIGARLIGQRMGESEFGRFLARLVPLPEPRPDRSDGDRAVRDVERVREALRTAYRTAPNLADIHGTRWGALQAVTAYVDHAQPTRQPASRTHAEARFERATEPHPLKDRALELLTEGGNRPSSAGAPPSPP